jgi:acyl-CoA thioesterase
MFRDGKVTQEIVSTYEALFKASDKFLEIKNPPSGMFAELLGGLAGKVSTSQDDLALPARTSSQWTRSRHPIHKESDHLGALAFYMDGALSFLPLTHSKMSLLDAGACSTLDFALRILGNQVDMSEWNFKEMKSVHGSDGRTYSEGRLYSRDGKMIAIMTQQSILRPPQRAKASL